MHVARARGRAVLICGDEVQPRRLSDLIIDVDTLVHQPSWITTSLAGDIILTSTPSGVGGARSSRACSRRALSSCPPSRASGSSTPSSSTGARSSAAELEVAYLGVQVADPTEFGNSLTDVVGLVPGDPTADGSTTWRSADRCHRIIVEEGPANDAVFVGLEAECPEAFDRTVCRAWAAGAPVTEGSPSEAAARRVAALVRIDTPWGVPFEIVYGLGRASEPFDSAPVPGGLVTQGQGIGQLVFVVTDLDAADRFARDALGLAQSDGFETDLGGVPLTVRSYHCKSRGHDRIDEHGHQTIQSLVLAS